MIDKNEENGQFRMRMDDAVDDNVIPAQVDELRIEKLGTRVTIISIIIPVLIVVVLVFAYLDIKKRVIRTEDTGASVVENMSKDMESRFSTLSVRQANLEELIKKMGAENNKSLARIQVKLKKIEDSAKSLKKTTVSSTVLKSTASNLEQEIGNVAKSVDQSQVKMDEMTQALKGQIDQISASGTRIQAQIAQIDEKLAGLNQKKIDKATLDLALKLEILKLKKGYEAQLGDIKERIRQLEQAPVTPSIPLAPPPPPAPKPSSKLTTPQTTPPATGGKIVEQEIVQ